MEYGPGENRNALTGSDTSTEYTSDLGMLIRRAMLLLRLRKERGLGQQKEQQPNMLMPGVQQPPMMPPQLMNMLSMSIGK